MSNFVAGLIDVFANAALGGNPLAVVEDADSLTEETMQRVAGEFNQAETTFLMKSYRADWKLRSFTANGSEVFGAGHKCAWRLAVAWVSRSAWSTGFNAPVGMQEKTTQDALLRPSLSNVLQNLEQEYE
jgi:PhzF family phenazine biosynthesis protein